MGVKVFQELPSFLARTLANPTDSTLLTQLMNFSNSQKVTFLLQTTKISGNNIKISPKFNAKEPPFWKHRIGGKYLIFLLAENCFVQHAVQSLLRFFQLFSLVFGVNQSNIAIKHTCNYCVTTAEKNVREARWRSTRENLGNILSLYFRW